MQNSLFCYGTLMVPKIINRVTQRVVQPGTPAELQDFGCFKVRQQTFPGIRPANGKTTYGILYRELTTADIKHLDRYEGYLYSRERVTVSTPSNDHTTWCYLIKPEYYPELLPEMWDYQHFLNIDLANFNRR